ncbi:MAG TPA: response regulator [Nitrospiraceae bacterium]|jgi:CheY-like chemotaxis protein|nr:response regulator [Nitrospiraceae bacterium]
MSRILIIDDESSLRQVLRIMLERAGHTVFDAPDGREGMALWHREPIDVVVTDIFMPDKDGIQVLMEMKKVARKPKIIAMSGGGQKGLLDWRANALALGADRVLVKPFDQRTFLLTIQEVLDGLPQTKDAVLPSSSTDQRKFPRLAVSLPVYFGNGVIAQSGTVVDISREGCRIRCPDVAPDLKYVQVEIRLDEPHETLRVDLAVRRWSRNGELGVEFIRMESDQQARLRSAIRRCEEAAASSPLTPATSSGSAHPGSLPVLPSPNDRTKCADQQ